MSNNKDSWSKLLWIGCGDCEGLEGLNRDFDKYLLIDARSSHHLSIPKDLRNAFKQVTVASECRIDLFKETNLPELSSLSINHCFFDKFPGLAIENEREVKTASVSELAEEFFADSESSTLILDIPDSHEEILRSLLANGTLLKLDEIIVWNVPQVSTSDGKELSIESLFIEAGFVPFKRNECFHGFNWLHLVKNPWYSRLKKLNDFKVKSDQLEQSFKNETEQNKAIKLRYEELKKIGMRLESQIELMQKLISSDT